MINITTQQFKDAAAALGIQTSTLMACAQVEGSGIGFFKSGKIIIKFEGHIFHMYTKGIYDTSHPTLSYSHWTEQYTQYGEEAYIRFDQAFQLNPHAAMLSTSWGAFQIMGENYSSCGQKTVDAFVTYLKVDIDNHLLAYDAYLRSQNLVRFLTGDEPNFDAYAYRYNGPMYQKNNYAALLRSFKLKFNPLNN